jgi:predicted pyridoxine 5'-phosphate oxidase superfamily flavin-nucleotide-binding protein
MSNFMIEMQAPEGFDDGFRFHAGEQLLQTRAGVRERMEFVGRRAVGDTMPDEHRELFERLPLLFLGARDPEGRPWAGVVTGPPGFVRTPDAGSLAVAALPDADDPFAAALVAGAPIGVLGLEFATRRRNRANGRVVAVGRDGFTLAVEESFGNCPKYIVPRELAPSRSAAEGAVLAEGPRLSARAQAMVTAADTVFLATVARPGIGGADVSHRGGPPGFVQVEDVAGATVLTMPDYPGNAFFNSFGNLVTDPRAGLLIVDFATGDALSLTGRATVRWEPAPAGGTGRTLTFTVERGRLRPGATALRAWPTAG